MENSIEKYLEQLKEYRNLTELESTVAFNIILEAIIKEIPDPYNSRLIVLNIINKIQPAFENDDLPF